MPEVTQMELFFPDIYQLTSHQSDSSAHHLMNQIITNLKTEFQFFNKLILSQKEKLNFRSKLEIADKFYPIFYCEYGCALLLHQKQSFSPISVSLIFPKEWDFNIYISCEKISYLADHPKASQSFQLGQLGKEYWDILIAKDELLKQIAEILKEQQNVRSKKYKGKDRKNHHTPSFILEIVKQTFKRRQQGKEAIQIQPDKNKEKKQPQEILSKGGTLDVGTHTGTTKPNTTLPVVISVLEHIFQSKNLVKLIIFEKKIFTFKRSIIKQRQIKIQKYRKYQECLIQLVHMFKTFVNQQIGLDESYFTKQVDNLNQILIKLLKKSNGSLITLKEIVESISDENISKNYTFSSILRYDSPGGEACRPPGSLGLSKSFLDIMSFKDLFEKKQIFPQSYWFMMVENYFFTIATQVLGPNNPIRIDVQQIKCSQNSLSTMHNIIHAYGGIIKSKQKVNNYGMKLSNQSYSHYYLIRLIGAAISFEVVKQERRNNKVNLEEYRCPETIEILYQQFYSLSYEARNALQSMVSYCMRWKQKKQLFLLQQSNKSYYDFVNQIAQQDSKIKQWIKSKTTELEEKVNRLEYSFMSFKQKYQNAKRQKISQQAKACTCYYDQVGLGRYKKMEKVKCQRCRNLHSQEQKITSFNSHKEDQISAGFAQYQINLYGFLNNIPPDILGMLKMVFQSQINPIEQVKQSNNKNFFTKSYNQLVIFTDQVKHGKINLSQNYSNMAINFVNYPSKETKFYYRGHNKSTKILQSLLAPQKIEPNLFHTSHQYMMNSPSEANSARQHEAYSKIKLKKKDEIINQYLQMASIRVAHHTEISMLTQKLKNRQFLIKFLIQNHKLDSEKSQLLYLKSLVVLNCFGCVQSYKYYNNGKLILFPIVEQCVVDLLKNYLDQWRFQDMYFLHITGVTFSLMSKLFGIQKYLRQIIAKVFQQYEKNEKQNKTNDNTIKSHLAYFLHGAFSYFNEDITYKLDKQSIFLWTKLQLFYRINKVFSDQNIKDQRFRQTMLFFQHYRERSIYNNIENITEYFKQYPSHLTQIIKLIDNGINPDIKWKFSKEKGDYVFIGLFENQSYQVNLFTGILLKNGGQLSGLPEIVKKNINYISIFGQNRDLQVYPQKDGSLRTRNDFSTFFPNQQGKIILFQFKIVKNQVIIRKIIKKYNQQTKYVLIPQTILNQSNFNLPQLYMKVYFAWFCDQEKILVFRCKKMQQLKNVCLVILLKKINDKLQIIQARVIQNNLKLQSISILKEEKSSNLFDLLIFYPKNASFTKVLKALSSIEHPAYILQVSSPNRSQLGTKRSTKFWLHRFNLKFTFQKTKGLLSDNFQGYVISSSYDHNQHLPWSPEDKINCLILEKANSDLRFAKNHKYLVLVPDIHVSFEKQKTIIPLGPIIQMKIISYEIHDHFHDLRGKKMLEQLHLACLAAVGYAPKLMVSNLQYAVHILRSCQSIKPLSKQELAKLQNILSNSIQLNQHVITLICVVIYQSSKLVHNILPFEKKKKENQLEKKNLFLNYFELIENCKFKHRKSFEEQKISIRLQLSSLELKVLSLQNYTYLQRYQSRQKNKWQQIYIKTIEISQDFDGKLQKWKRDLYESFKLKRSIVDKSEGFCHKNTQFQSILQLQNSCKMSSDQRQQITSSLRSYAKVKHKLNQIHINKQQKHKYLQCLNDSQQLINKNCIEIQNMLKKMQESQEINLDLITKRRSVIKQIDFTHILCNPRQLEAFYPGIPDKTIQKFNYIILVWMQNKIESNSLQRLQQVLRDEQFDKISLLREIESPREEISKNVVWIAFEAQMKTQIWLSQLQTFKLLSGNNSGVVTQLNMGQGKTQVIIPMIVLNEIYNKSCQIPRVHILTPLYHEAQENYFKFLSITGFKLHLLPICFNRQVQINPTTINRLQHAVDLYKTNSLVLVDRDSTLSMILKMRQESGFRKAKMSQQFVLDEKCHKKDRWIFRNLKMVDIFDEVDALMTAKKAFVYAIGHSISLPNSRIRFQYSSLFIEIILKQMFKDLIDSDIISLEQCYDHAISSISDGKFPKGLRFLTKEPSKIHFFRQTAVRFFFNKYSPPQFEFYNFLSHKEREALIQYCINERQDERSIPSNLSRNVHNQIYMVRGLLAYGIIEHCLSMRNGVDYGVPGSENLKRVGVPYQAADVPSKRSEYSHPEVATILSYLSYFNKGLTYKQFEETLKCLLRQTNSSRQRNYREWIKCIANQAIHPLSAKNVKQINQESAFQKQQLYNSFRKCRATIVFWLIHCVFPTDLAQYTKSITCSSWDLADSKKSIGFSGTKDTHWLFPEYLYLKESINDEINGTDGKMIQLMLENTNDVVEIKRNDEDLWKRFCQTSLQLKIGCLIDAGAILAGKSLEKQIVPWISNHPLFKQLNFKGISYCNENGVWKVYDTSTHSTIARQTSIPEHQTFVIFDEARTRGADIKLKTETVATLSLGPDMAKDKLMQAVGRLRKFGRNQKIYILSTLQNYNKIDGLNLSDTVYQKTKKVLEWVCRNSISDNKKMMYPNSKLAWIHFNNTKSKEEVVVQQFDPSLKKMYEGAIQFNTIENLNQEMAYEHIRRYGDCQLVIYLQQNIKKFGDSYMVRCQSLEDICEREIQMIEEAQRTAEIQTDHLKPLPQTSTPQIYNQQISTLNIKLHNRLLFTSNFIQCTKSKSLYPNKKKEEEENELCLIHFVLINPSNRSMMVLTQRQASSKIQQGIRFLGPESLDEVVNTSFLVRFKDLSIKSHCMSHFDLEQILTDAQFFNGAENYQNKQLLLKTIRANEIQLSGVKSEQIICHFLERRRTVEDKYMCSDLEAIFKQIINAR